MSLLYKKLAAFQSLVNRVVGFVRTVSGIPPLNLPYAMKGKADNYVIEGNSAQMGVYDEETGKYKLDVVNRGVNLLTFPYTTSPGIYGGLVKPFTINGITYTPHEDGSITIDGTSTAAYSVYIWGDKTSLIPGLKVGDTITISKNPDDLSQHANVYFVCNYYDSEGTMRSGAVTSNATTNTKVITEDWVGIGVYIHVPKEKTLNNLTIKPQIQIGSAATDYEPYREPITTSIFIDKPLENGESISYLNDNLPELLLSEGSNVISIDGDVQPSNMTVIYKASVKEV